MSESINIRILKPLYQATVKIATSRSSLSEYRIYKTNKGKLTSVVPVDSLKTFWLTVSSYLGRCIKSILLASILNQNKRKKSRKCRELFWYCFGRIPTHISFHGVKIKHMNFVDISLDQLRKVHFLKIRWRYDPVAIENKIRYKKRKYYKFGIWLSMTPSEAHNGWIWN